MAKRKKTRRTRRPKGYEGDVSARRKGLTQRDALCILALALMVAVSYFPAVNADFVWDDVIFTQSEPVQDVGGLYQIWFSPSAIEGEAHYWPIVYSSFWLEHKLWGFAPARVSRRQYRAASGQHAVAVAADAAPVRVWCVGHRRGVRGASPARGVCRVGD